MAKFNYNDGGRKAAGFKGSAGDCFVRAVAIAEELQYRDVYDAVNLIAKSEKDMRGKAGMRAACGKGSSSRNGVWMYTAKAFMEKLGWKWTPTSGIGTGTKVHLRADELPAGRIIARCSRHYVAVIDGVIQDTHDSSRNGTRAVYGYWSA